MESTSSEPVVPLLADALDVLMKELISEAHIMREIAEEPGTPPLDAAISMTVYRRKSNLAYRISRLVDEYRKGKLA